MTETDDVRRLASEWLAARAACDPDYSPAYQDEYQRLWHQAAAERDRLRELCRPVVEGYGAHYRRDAAYYAAAEALGIEASEEAPRKHPGPQDPPNPRDDWPVA